MTQSANLQNPEKTNNTHWHTHSVNKFRRSLQKLQKPTVFWLTGLSGSGKSTIASMVEESLYIRGNHTFILDGDNIRMGLNKDLGFGNEDREENIRRIGEVSKLFCDSGLILLCAFISPFENDRNIVRELVGEGNFYEVFVKSSLEMCESRDPKGLYVKARSGEIPFFTGIDSPYEAPANADITLDTEHLSAESCARKLIKFMENKMIISTINNATEKSYFHTRFIS